MPTKNAIISDIILRISKGKPSDDVELERGQVAYWIDIVLGALLKDNLDKKLMDKKAAIEPSYICWDKDVEPKVKGVGSRWEFYIDLCSEPMNLYRDGGVIRVSTDDLDWVDKMKMEEIDNLLKMKYSKPSLKNIKYTRVKKRLYLYGLTLDTFILVKFDIAYVPKPQFLTELSDSDEVYIGEDILPILAEEVEKLARRQVYQSDQDLENDAQQDLDVQ